MNRVADATKGIAASAGILVLLSVVPYALWTLGGTPGVGILDALSDPLATDDARLANLLAGLLLIIAWASWVQVAFALATETVAAVRGRAALRVPILPGIQAVAARLVATAALTLTSLAPTATALAAPLLPADLAHSTQVAQTVDHRVGVDASADVGAANDKATYLVRERDTFWSIAEVTLGDGLRWHEIRDANIGSTMADGTTISPATEAVRAGWAIELPPLAVVPTAVADPATAEPPTNPPATETELSTVVEVEPGDHFWSIAEDTLADRWGRSPADAEITPYWGDLVAMNHDDLRPPGDPNIIYPDQRFDLPDIPEDPLAPPPQDPSPPLRIEEVLLPPDRLPVPTTTAEAPEAPETTPTKTPTSADERPSVRPHSASDTNDNADMVTAALGIGSVAAAAGALMLTLKHRRRHRAAKRQPEAAIETPSRALAGYEDRIRPIADTESARWIAATSQLITNRLGAHPQSPLPAVFAIRAGRFGAEILLDAPLAPIDGFVAANDDHTAWRIHSELELDALEAEVEGVQPYSPALACVGTTEAGDLFLDLEQLSVVSVEGDHDDVAGWMRSLALGISANPWSQFCEVVAIGVPDDFEQIDGVTAPVDPEGWCEQTSRAMTVLHERLGATPYEQRIRPGEIFHPTVVFVGPDHQQQAKTLAGAATLINAPLVVIAASPLPLAERIHVDPMLSTLEPAGLTFIPLLTSPTESRAIDQLLEIAARAESAPPTEVAETPAATEYAAAELDSLEDFIQRVTTPRPVQVKLLTAMPSVEGLHLEPSAKQLAVIGYLAYHRAVPSTRIREAFWPGSTNRSTADNAISQVRRILGVDADGQNRLAQAINSGQYELSAEVGTDWETAEALISEANRRAGDEAMELLRTALALVDGQIAKDAPPQQFAWLSDDHAVYGHIEAKFLDAAHKLGAAALAAADFETANWAANRGLAIVPGNEAMYRLQMKTAAAAGETKALHAAYDEARRSAAQLGPWVEVDSQTDELFKTLTESSEATDR